jgi:hypothetical protein
MHDRQGYGRRFHPLPSGNNDSGGYGRQPSRLIFESGQHPHERLIEMKKISCANAILCLCLLAAMSLLMNCSPTSGTQTNPISKTKEGVMDPAYKSESYAIPPIDAAVPTNFETASFGLG